MFDIDVEPPYKWVYSLNYNYQTLLWFATVEETLISRQLSTKAWSMRAAVMW
jgi:hypothetical protein